MMNLRQMEVFHAVVRTGSVTGAARMLNVTQPAVSAILKHCESQIRIKLFHRKGGRLQPTAEARAIIPDIEAIFERVGIVGKLTADLAGGREGFLSIAASVSIANGYLAAAVGNYASKHPNTRFLVQSLTSPQVLDRVAKGEVEIGIVYGSVAGRHLKSEELFPIELVCAMPEAHPLAGKASIRIEDLAGIPIATYVPHALFRKSIDTAFESAGIAPDIRIQFAHSIVGLMAAAHGGGVAIIDGSVVKTFDIPGLTWRSLMPTTTIKAHLVYLEDAPLSKAMSTFLHYLRERFM